jgi:hypothetical protein
MLSSASRAAVYAENPAVCASKWCALWTIKGTLCQPVHGKRALREPGGADRASTYGTFETNSEQFRDLLMSRWTMMCELAV